MVLPDYTTQTASEYKANIDAEIASNKSALAGKAEKAVPLTANDIALLDILGNLVDGGVSIADLLARANHTGTQNLSTISDSGALASRNTVGNSQIDNDAVTGGKIASSTITDDNIATNTILAGSIAEGAVGQSEIATGGVGSAEIQSESVGQGELRTATSSVSHSTTTETNITLPGGNYGFYPTTRHATSGIMSARVVTASAAVGSSYTCRIALYSSSGTANAIQRYMIASKPYDLGDGLVGRFIFAVINNATKKVESIYNATEAPWHYNGPTDIIGKVDKEGRKWRTRKDMSAHPRTIAQARLNTLHMAAYAQAFADAPIIKEEITQEIKNADMYLIPHPFQGNDLTGKTVVMLDPVSDLNHELAELCDAHDDFDLNELFHEGYLQISNQGLQRSGPEGILIPSFKWKK